MSEVASLNIDLSLITAKFQEGMARAQKAMSDFEKSVKPIARSFEKFGKQLEDTGSSLTKNLTVPLAAASAALGVALHKTAEYGDEINNMSVRTGISRGELQELKFAAGQVGVEFGSLVTANKEVTKSIGEVAMGNQKTGKLFKQLGVAVKDANGNLRSSGDVMNDLIGALSSVENETTRNIIGQELFGKSYTELIPLVKQGKDGLKGFAAEARAAGLIMSDEAVIAADDFGDKMDKLKSQLGHAGMEIASAFMPIITKLADFVVSNVVPAIKAAAEWFKGLTDTQQGWVIGIGAALAAIGPLLTIVGKFSGIISSLVSFMPKLAGAFTLMTGPVGLVIAAVAAVGAAAAVAYNHFNRLSDVTNAQADAMDKAKASATGELGEVDRLVMAAQNEYLSRKDRIAAVQELQDKYPGYLGNLSQEAIMSGQASTQIDALRKNILRLAEARAIEDKIKELAERRAQAIITKGTSELTMWDNLSNYVAMAAGSYENITGANERMNETVSATEKEITKLQTQLGTYTDVVAEAGDGNTVAKGKVDALNISFGAQAQKLEAVTDGFDKYQQDAKNAAEATKVAMAPVAAYIQPIIDKNREAATSFEVMGGISAETAAMVGTVVPAGIAPAKQAIMDFTSIVQAAMESTAAAVGEAVGAMVTGVGSIGGVLSSIMSGIADFVGNFGKAMIAASTAAMLAKASLATPASLAAGIALVSLSAVLKNVITKNPMGFADGGLVFGETMGIVGEGRGTSRSNPEVIAPLDKLMDFMPEGDGGGRVYELVVKGETLRALIKRTDSAHKFLGRG